MIAFTFLDILALAVIAWAAFAFLHAGHEVRTVCDLILWAGLLCVMIGALCGAMALGTAPRPLAWWAHLLLFGAAVVAGWLYDYRFGVARHVRMAVSALRGVGHGKGKRPA